MLSVTDCVRFLVNTVIVASGVVSHYSATSDGITAIIKADFTLHSSFVSFEYGVPPVLVIGCGHFAAGSFTETTGGELIPGLCMRSRQHRGYCPCLRSTPINTVDLAIE